MTDFWEVIARMVTDSQFRNSVYAGIAPGGYPMDSAKPAVIIPEDRYNLARTLISPVISDGPVSLMALGELLLAISTQTVRNSLDDLSAAVAAAAALPSNPSKLLFVALGVMILDDTMRDAFNQGLFDPQFSRLSNPERQYLMQMSDPNGNVKAKATVVCALGWAPACFVKYNFYQGHEHPLANAA